MRYWGALLGIVMLIVAVIFITMYGISSLSVLENMVNMSGNPYQVQWNATTSTAIASIAITTLHTCSNSNSFKYLILCYHCT